MYCPLLNGGVYTVGIPNCMKRNVRHYSYTTAVPVGVTANPRHAKQGQPTASPNTRTAGKGGRTSAGTTSRSPVQKGGPFTSHVRKTGLSRRIDVRPLKANEATECHRGR